MIEITTLSELTIGSLTPGTGGNCTLPGLSFRACLERVTLELRTYFAAFQHPERALHQRHGLRQVQCHALVRRPLLLLLWLEMD